MGQGKEYKGNKSKIASVEERFGITQATNDDVHYRPISQLATHHDTFAHMSSSSSGGSGPEGRAGGGAEDGIVSPRASNRTS